MSRGLLTVVITFLGGCLAGVGPVLAVRTNGDVALGVEGNAGLDAIELEAGAMFLARSHAGAAGTGSGESLLDRASGYAALTGTFLWNSHGEGYYAPFSTGLQGQLGIAWGQVGTGLLVGIGPEISSTVGDTSCVDDTSSPDVTFNVRIGMRGFGKIAEFYLAPTISVAGRPCI